MCKECIDENNKCLNCNSIFKKGEISDDIKNLYSNIKINCKYKECGCDEILSSNELLNHENSIIPYRIIINNENDKNKLNDLLFSSIHSLQNIVLHSEQEIGFKGKFSH